MSLIIVLQNISKLAPTSDYKYEVLIGDGTSLGSRTLEYGTISGHTRSDGWWALLQKLIEQRKRA